MMNPPTFDAGLQQCFFMKNPLHRLNPFNFYTAGLGTYAAINKLSTDSNGKPRYDLAIGKRGNKEYCHFNTSRLCTKAAQEAKRD
ncbi:hypothetical protein NO559_11840 [Dasania sp. GY-MA-18]|uniref:Uncharacterized protein n=1 Tax=Dasania phycosphaerae TaxID=2950436 RepID=A0A9J6RP48_9GAMM|nr:MULTISPECIES: hypothetical protein [Dasania]MCR8923470.1 hypothetical protein [Dasania sp. GY-MA-18]MCZ0865903.1 hypothetical protein [Dasania phycosphaerae]MCZ0869627.1 hypothetical protein [Dasania phycosphaerae]